MMALTNMAYSTSTVLSSQAVIVGEQSFMVQSGSERRAFWQRVSAGNWEPQTFRVYRRFLHSAASYIDIGAWIGPTVLYGAHLAHHVYALEPDPVAHAELAMNVLANPTLSERISLYRECIAPHTGRLNLYAGGMYYGGSSLFGDSMSGIIPVSQETRQPARQVDGVRLDEFMQTHSINDCNFIKMDVEGREYTLIPGLWRKMAAYGMPTLLVSFHAPAPAQRESLIMACLQELQSCYQWVYGAASGGNLDLERLAASVTDWADETPGSPWRILEHLLGEGIVATNEEW